MSFYQYLGAVEIGCIYAFVTLAVYLTFQVIDFADLTVDGSFVIGGAIFAKTLLMTQSLMLGLMLGFFASFICGVITVVVALKLKIPSLLASIIVMSALYSVSMRILGQPNMALLGLDFALPVTTLVYAILLIFVVGLIFLLNTEFGLMFFALGKNKALCERFTIPTFFLTILVVGLSNGMVGMAGALQTYYQGFVDVSMGTGTVIMGFATVILAEKLYSKNRIEWIVLSCVLASILYRMIISFALNSDMLGIASSDINMMSSLMIIAIIYFNLRGKKNAAT